MFMCMCEEIWSETGSLNVKRNTKRKNKVQWGKSENKCVYVRMHSAMSLHVCVSEMDRLWPGHINSLPDWLQLSGNVTGEPERDLIAIRELPPSSRGQRARRRNSPSKPPSLHEQVHCSAQAESY